MIAAPCLRTIALTLDSFLIEQLGNVPISMFPLNRFWQLCPARFHAAGIEALKQVASASQSAYGLSL
jgi:hypothetical protein